MKCTEVDRRGNRKCCADDWFANSHGIEGRAAIAAARSVCGECRFAVECLLGAVERGEKHGIWGGINMEIASGAGIRTTLGQAARPEGGGGMSKITLLDYDGCVYDFVGAWAWHVGIDLPDGYEPTKWEFYEDFGWDREAFLLSVEEMAEDTSWHTLEGFGKDEFVRPRPEVAEYLRNWADAPVCVISSRPDVYRVALCMRDQIWTEFRSMPNAILLGVTNKVAMAEAFRAQGHDVTVIEDCPQIVEELRAAGFEVVMPVHKYNEHLMAVGV